MDKRLWDAFPKKTPAELGQDVLDEVISFSLLTTYDDEKARAHILKVKSLIAAGARPDEKTSSGDTALILAARSGQVDLVPVLIGGGAKLDEENNAGETALMAAEQKGYEGFVTLLKTAAEEISKIEKEKKKQYLDDTDFSKGLPHDMIATRPLRPKQPRI